MKPRAKKLWRLKRPQLRRFGKLVLLPLLLCALVVFLVLHRASAKNASTEADLATITNAAVLSNVPDDIRALSLHNLHNRRSDYSYSSVQHSPFGGSFDLCATFAREGLDVTDLPGLYESPQHKTKSTDFSQHRKGKQCFHVASDDKHGTVTVRPALTAAEQQIFDKKQAEHQAEQNAKERSERLRYLATQPKIPTQPLDYKLLVSTAANIVKTQAPILGLQYQDQDMRKSCSDDAGWLGISSAPNGKAYSCRIEMKLEYVRAQEDHDALMRRVNSLTAASKQLGFTKGQSLGDKGFIDDEGGLINFSALGTINGFQCSYGHTYTKEPEEYHALYYLEYNVYCYTPVHTDTLPPGFSG